MKRNYGPILIAVALVAAVAILLVSRNYSNRLRQEKLETATEYSTTQITTTSVEEGQRRLLDEVEEGDYQLYYYPETEKVELVHGDIVKEFNWGWSVKIHIPEMAYYDVDEDGEKELVMRVAASSKTDDAINAQPYAIYNLFVVEEVETDGVKDLAFFMAGASTWQEPFKEHIKVEITQLKSSKKFIQVAMNNADVGISYDDAGMTNNEYTYYAAAYRDTKNHFYTLDTWNFNSGIYTFDEKRGKMVLDISIIVQYEEEEFREYIGNINCDISFSNGKFHLTPNTITFIPMSPKVVVDPRDGASKSWSVTLKNSSADPKADAKDINWIENQFDITALKSENSIAFASLPSKIKYVDSVVISESKIVMTAMPGYTFSQRVIDSGTFTITIEGDDGSSSQIDNTCEITTDGSGRSILTMTFDKTYNQNDLKTLRIKYGV